MQKFLPTRDFAEVMGHNPRRVDWLIRTGRIAPEYLRMVGRKRLIRIDTPIPDLKPGRKKACSNG